MRKYSFSKWMLGICLLFFTGYSCTDALDEAPSDMVNIERLLRNESIIGFRNNSYHHLNATFVNHHAGELLDAFTDDSFRAGTGISYDWHNGLLSPEMSMFANTMWHQYWQGVRRTNLALYYFPQATASELVVPQNSLNLWTDEVRILRAWYHFKLIKNFGPVPFLDQAYSTDFQGWGDMVRPTYEEITNRIVEEIDIVIANRRLPLRWQVSGDFDKINLAMAYALKSRVLLYNASVLNNPTNDPQKWQRAATAAQECITAITPTYQLLPMSEYSRLFLEDVTVLNPEVIYRSSANNAAAMNNNNGVDLRGLGSATQSANAGSVPSQELVDAFELKNGALPVVSYNNPAHTNVTFSSGYSENPGDDPYANRDARFYHSIVFNGSEYGRYKGMPAAAPNLVVFTYEGKPFTGFNNNPTSQAEADIRRSTTGYYGRKYRSATYWGATTGGVNANKIYFRLAEIYLNLAEAQCELGNLAQAMSALNVVRNRAGQPNIQDVPGFTQTREWLLNRIRNERRVELCFEEHRFYDQRRWNILQTNSVVTGMRVTSSDGTDNGTFSYERVRIDIGRTATSQRYLRLPIPIQEARRLPGLGQPAGY